MQRGKMYICTYHLDMQKLWSEGLMPFEELIEEVEGGGGGEVNKEVNLFCSLRGTHGHILGQPRRCLRPEERAGCLELLIIEGCDGHEYLLWRAR